LNNENRVDAENQASSVRLQKSAQVLPPRRGSGGTTRTAFHVSDNIAWRVSLAVAGLAIFVMIWYLYAVWVGDPFRVAGPASALNSLSSLLQNQIPPSVAGVSNIYDAIISTLELIAIGFAVSLVGIPVGFLMGRWRAAEAIIDPWINALYAIPMVALAPLIYLSIPGGGSFNGDLAIVFLMTFFTITINTFHGVKYVSNSYAEIGRSFCASEAQFLRHILLPASLPDIVSGMRLGLGRAVLGSIVAEVLLSHNGLGYMMISFQSLTRVADMEASISIIALLGIFFLNTPRLVERSLFKWKQGERLSRNI